MPTSSVIVPAALCLFAGVLDGCASGAAGPEEAGSMSAKPETPADPPPRIREWMDRLTVEHAYDPRTGFIVAREVIGLPPVIASGPPVAEAIRAGAAESRLVVVFATADRCAPCQQYKKSALNDPRVVLALARPGLIATHVEVDREPEVAESVLGSRAIPMTYLFRDGRLAATLRGQRSADDLLAWLAEHGAMDAAGVQGPADTGEDAPARRS